MPRWVLWTLVVDSILIPIAVVLFLVGQTAAGIGVVVLDVVLIPVFIVFGRGGLNDEAQRNAELSASGVPGKTAPQQQHPNEGRIFEE